MTNELEKTFFDTFGIEPIGCNDNENCTGTLDCRTQCPNAKYPQITESKQLELIKWLVCNIDHLDIYKNPKDYFLACLFKGGKHTDFSQALAGLVCELWEGLTDEQREEVRGILQ